MNTNQSPTRLPDLLNILEQLRNLYESLEKLIRQKLDAMRRADLHAMRELQQEETALVHRIHERDGLRRQLMDILGPALGFTGRQGRSAGLSEVASRLADPYRGDLLAAADALRRAVTGVAQANRVAGVATRDVLNHMRWIGQAIRPAKDRPGGYAPDGGVVPPADTLIIDALG